MPRGRGQDRGSSSDSPQSPAAKRRRQKTEEQSTSGSSPKETGSDAGGAGDAGTVKADGDAIFAEVELFVKFKDVSILIDSQYLLPKKVWFLKCADTYSPVDAVKKDYFTILYAGTSDTYEDRLDHGRATTEHAPGIRDANFLDVKSLASDVPNKDTLEIVLDLFKDMSSCLSHGKYRTWNIEFKKNMVLNEKVAQLRRKSPEVAAVFLLGRFVRAFMKNMSNSAGKKAMQGILELASLIVFGDAFYNSKIACFTMGSSDARECFPVKLAPVEFLKPNALPEVEPHDSASNVFPPSQVALQRSSTTSSARQKGVYADLVLISGVEKKLPHFIFVGEVKKGSGVFSLENEVQLIKEMLGPIMHQSLVFGLLMNETGARLCSMRQDMDEKKIYVTFDDYSFAQAKTFFDSFKDMFLHIINALIYSKQNMKQIARKFSSSV